MLTLLLRFREARSGIELFQKILPKAIWSCTYTIPSRDKVLG